MSDPHLRLYLLVSGEVVPGAVSILTYRECGSDTYTGPMSVSPANAPVRVDTNIQKTSNKSTPHNSEQTNYPNKPDN